MNKIIFTLFLLVFPYSVLGQDLVIDAGTEYRIDKSQQVLTLDSLTIGDNARIVFAEDVSDWSLNVSAARIGNEVVIDGRGNDGEPGKDGYSWADVKSDCGDGRDGANGTDGGPGNAGLNLTFNLGLVSLGSLDIDVSGGSGGAGGNGGKGEDAGFGKTCLRADGGNSGNGGNGGAGGNGGDLRLSLWSADAAVPLNTFIQGIETRADSGPGGGQGKKGEVGQGSPSQYSNIPTVTGARRRTPAGDDGESGVDGQVGRPGSNGSVSVNVLVPGEAPPIIGRQQFQQEFQQKKSQQNTNETAADNFRDRELEQLRRKLQALERRIEKLEQQ